MRHKGAEAAEGTPGGDGRQQETDGGRFQPLETEGGPDNQRNAGEFQGIISDCKDGPIAEHAEAEEADGQQQGRSLGILEGLPVKAGATDPQHKQRSQDEGAGGVSQPPSQPNGLVVHPTGVAEQREAGDTEGGAYRGADDSRKECELENVLGAFECIGPAGEPVDEVSAQQSFQSVPYGDTDGGGDGARRRHVHQERAQQDGGPYAIPQQQKGRQCDAAGRPDGGRAGVHEGEFQAEFAGGEVDHQQSRHDWEEGREPATHYLHLAPLCDGSPFAGNGGTGSRINRTMVGVKQRRGHGRRGRWWG